MLRYLALLALLLVTPAAAQDHNFPTPGNAIVPGFVTMCINGSNQAVPCAAGGGLAAGAAVTGCTAQANLFVTSTLTLGCVAPVSENDTGLTFTLGGILQMPDTTSATVGVIQFGGARFLHDQNATSNVFLGHNAYNFTGTGTTSVCVGESCMLTAVSGSGNTCVGRFCMGGALSGTSNTAMGANVMGAVTNGGANVGIGASANQVTTASNTTCVGASSCAAATGSGSSAFGFSAGGSMTGANNTILGSSAGANLGGGGTNTFVGAAAGGGVTTGTGNTVIGQACSGLAAGLTSGIILGNAACVAKLDFGVTAANIWTFLGGTIAAPLTTDATHTDATVCRDTTSGQFFFGSGTGGICLGTSGRQFKRDIAPVEDVKLDQIIALKPSRYFNREDSGLDPNRPQVGLIADEVKAILPDCATDKTVDYLCVSVMSLQALKQLAAEVAELKRNAH